LHLAALASATHAAPAPHTLTPDSAACPGNTDPTPENSPTNNIQGELNVQDSLKTGAMAVDQGNNSDSLNVHTVGNSDPSSSEDSRGDSDSEKEIEKDSDKDDSSADENRDNLGTDGTAQPVQHNQVSTHYDTDDDDVYESPDEEDIGSTFSNNNGTGKYHQTEGGSQLLEPFLTLDIGTFGDGPRVTGILDGTYTAPPSSLPATVANAQIMS